MNYIRGCSSSASYPLRASVCSITASVLLWTQSTGPLIHFELGKIPQTDASKSNTNFAALPGAQLFPKREPLLASYDRLEGFANNVPPKV